MLKRYGNNSRIKKRITGMSALALTGLLAAGQGVVIANAAAVSTEKEEVVYGMLTSEGKVDGVYVVNSFYAQDIVDYGDYSEVRNLTTTDVIDLDGGMINIHRAADSLSENGKGNNQKLYYQGNLDTTDLPWDIAFRYYMDGEEVSAEEIAGMSGALMIKIDITQNEQCDSRFWEGYALQATVTLDSQKCRNIVADNATIANVGSDKQLSYIILPGKGASLEIRADVTDFEIDAVSINGVKLNLNFDPDTQSLTDKIEDIRDAIAELNDGTGELYDGASALNDGAKSLETGISDLNDGIEQIQAALSALDGKSDDLTLGSGEVMKALETIQSSLDQLKISSRQLQTFSQSSAQIKSGIDSLAGGLQTIENAMKQYYSQLADSGVTGDDLIANNQKALNSLGITNTQRQLYGAYTSLGITGVQSKLAQLVGSGEGEALDLYNKYVSAGYDSSVLTDYLTNAGKLISIETLLRGDISYIQGSSALISSIYNQIDSQKGQLMSGALALQSSYGEFDTVVQNMVLSLGSLASDMDKLKTAVNMLTEKYAVLDSGLGSYTDAVGQILTGYEKIYNGSAAAAAGTKDLYAGTTELVDGVAQLYEGTAEFQDETSDMDAKVNGMIDDTLDELTGRKVETISFVSEKNTNVDSVLFVMKTPAIEIQEEEIDTAEENVETTLIQKFINLFKK